MALTYRSPLEENLATYDSSVQAAIVSTSANYYRDLEEEQFRFFNYHLKPEAKKKLIDAGLYISPNAAVPHSHPVCKTLENHFLYIVLPPLLDNQFFFVGIKNFKLDLIKTRNSKLSLVQKINRYVTSLDSVRYGSDFVVRSTKMDPRFRRHGCALEGATLRDLIPPLMEKSAKKIFLHDEIHYWSHRELITFLEMLKPDVMYATMVFPPEILSGATASLNKWCYTFEIIGKDMLFYPDNARTEGYQQPFKNGYLLKARRIVLGNGDFYNVDVVHSKFAHHLIAITKGKEVGPTVRSFGPFEATACHGMEPLVRNVNNCFPVAFEVVSRVYRYLRTLKKPDEESAMAKLSQLLPEPSGLEIKFLQDFSNLVIHTSKINTMIKPDRINSFLNGWFRKLPKFIADKMSSVQRMSLDEFITLLEPYTFHVQLEDIDWNYAAFFELYSCAEADYGVDVIKLMDDMFTIGNSRDLVARVPRPVVMAKDCEAKPQVMLSIHEMQVRKYVVKVMLSEVLSESMRVVSRRGFAEMLEMKIQASRSSILPRKGMLKLFYNAEWLSGRIRTALSFYAKHILVIWAEDMLGWFSTSRRCYQKSLTNYPDGKTLNRQFAHIFTTVVSEMEGFDKKNLTKRGLPNWMIKRHQSAQEVGPGRTANKGVGEASEVISDQADISQLVDELRGDEENRPSAGKGCKEVVQQVNPEIGEASLVPVLEPEKDMITGACRVFQCACRLEMPITKVPYPEVHAFKAPDILGNRRAGWYSKVGMPYCYNGGNHSSLGWPQWLENWMDVNRIDTGYYNCCLYQIYNGNAKIGFHADDEEIFEKGGRVLTVNISGTATFSVRCGQGVSATALASGDCFEMPLGFQGSHKHSVGQTSVGRDSVTFRRTVAIEAEQSRAQQAGEADLDIEDHGSAAGSNDVLGSTDRCDSHDESEGDGPLVQGQTGKNDGPGSVDCEYGVISYQELQKPIKFKEYKVPGDGDCFWHAVGASVRLSALEIKKLSMRSKFSKPDLEEKRVKQSAPKVYAEDESIILCAHALNATITIYDSRQDCLVNYTPKGQVTKFVSLILRGEHFNPIEPLNNCVPIAIAKALGREVCEVMCVIAEELSETTSNSIWDGQGVELDELGLYFEVFDIAAFVESQGKMVPFNERGVVKAAFTLKDGHLEFSGKNCVVNVEVLRGGHTNLSVTERSEVYLQQCSNALVYRPKLQRAKNLAKSFENGCTGVVNSALFNKQDNLLKGVCAEVFDRDWTVQGIFGTFGAGKSFMFGKFFNLNPGKCVMYVSPRKALADEFRQKVFHKRKGALRARPGDRMKIDFEKKNWHICTFEVAFRKLHLLKPGCAIIVDEIQLYPPGYLDLLLAKLSPGVKVFVGGDPCQSDYDSEKDRAWLGLVPSDIEMLLKNMTYDFNVSSRRFTNYNMKGRLPCEMENLEAEEGSEPHLLYQGIDEMELLEDEFNKVFLVSSFDEKKIVETYFDSEKTRVLTFGESTGLNFRSGTIIITNVSSQTSEKRWVTALSRFSHNLCLVNLLDTSWENLLSVYKGRFLQKFISRTACVQDLAKLLPGNPIFKSGFMDKVGLGEGQFEEKAQGDPWLKGMIDLLQIADTEEEPIIEEIMQEEWFKTHLPQAEMESVRARWVHKILAKEFREVRMGSIVSEQFTDEYAKDKGKVLTNAAERFETIYPRHKANDTVTFLMAVKKRLRFSCPAKEKAKLLDAQHYGKFLLSEFLKRVPLNGKHEPDLMVKAKAAFEEKKMSKSAATIENHAGRSCRDWLIDIGLIFSKSQLCTKFDNRFRMAKAAQSIVCFQHEVLCRFAPYMRYMEMKLHQALPKNYYIHSGKGLEELNEWVKLGKFSGVCTESDYEAFDASQDQFIVAFEVEVMKYLGLPNDLIEDYKFIKTHLGSKLGNFAIMRFSGEASTFLFNTMANMLFTFLRYNIKGSEYICFAGDDMCASERLSTCKTHEGFLSKLKLKAKVFMVSKPTFCGWHLCPDGIYKKPQLVMERMCIAKEKNNLQNCIDNYAIEVSFAYRLGERAVNRMDEEELEAFYNCVRIIVKNKHLLKSDIKDLFTNVEM